MSLEFGEPLGWYSRLEGVDFAGKTTQLELAKEYNEKQGIGAVFVREPGGTALGVQLREILLHDRSIKLQAIAEFTLFTADRIHLWDTIILPALQEGRPVISDRGIESSIAYQSKEGGAAEDGVSTEMMLDISSRLLDPRYMRPDALALLTLSKAARHTRMIKRFESEAADKLEGRHIEFSNRVFAAYKELEKLDYIQAVDGDRPEEVVFEELKPILFGQFAK